MKIRVLLVEDQQIMQKYFASMVQGDERFLLVDVLNDGEKAVSYCNHTVVDLVLMDVQTFQNHDGLLAAETIKKQHPAVKIIVITSLVDPEILTRAKEKGADSLWYKDHGQEEIMEVIDRTLEGKHVFPDKAPAVELKWMKSDEISPRQLEMLRLYIKGYSYSEIGKQMNCSAAGVRWNFQDMIAKAGYSCKEELLAAVLESKLVVSTLKDWQTL